MYHQNGNLKKHYSTLKASDSMLQLFEPYKIDKPIRLIELFAGYGSQALALENLGVDFEHHKVVEFDKYAIKSYNALHSTNYETEDITKVNDLNVVDRDKYTYIMTYSFPCQDLSRAGKGSGMGEGTRSGLLWEVERLLKQNELPQVLIMENVTQVHGAKNKEDFYKWTRFLTKLGYSNQWQDLNAKDYGIPQNRNRTFMVSILGNYKYHFPKPIKLETRLKDYLEDSVDEKYYLSDKMLNYLQENDKKQKERGNGFAFEPTYGDTVARTIRTRNGSRMGDNFIVDHIGNVDIGNNDNVINPSKDKTKYVGVVNNLRIRKLTPRECFRLMGLNDNQINRIFKSGNSNTQLYKQAGNSIVIQVLEAIFKEMT